MAAVVCKLILMDIHLLGNAKQNSVGNVITYNI